MFLVQPSQWDIAANIFQRVKHVTYNIWDAGGLLISSDVSAVPKTSKSYPGVGKILAFTDDKW